MSEDLPLSEERDGPVVTLVMNDTRRLNPLTKPLQSAMLQRVRELGEDRSVRALVLTGEGRGFCVGADLSSMGPSSDEPGTLGERTANWMQELTNPLALALREAPFPVVNALNGACAGAGAGLALCADIVIAARSAYLYLPFLPKLGIAPDMGSTWFLERLAGRSRAMGLALLGDKLSAEQAQQWGLVWQVVDDAALRPEAQAIAQRLARLPAHAVGEARRAFAAAASNDLRSQLAYEAGRQRELIDGPDFAEGVRAFREKREPNFGSR